MARANGIVWAPNNPFFASNNRMAMIVRFEAGLAAYTAGFAKRVEAYAKENAPWEDRTGDARSGLNAKGFQRLTEYTIVLSHAVDYGVWLEVRWSGQYAIIIPTLEAMGPKYLEELSMAGLLAGRGLV